LGKRAIFIGRFSPFHLGHLEIVKQILKEENELIIAIGSAQQSHTMKNPFTAGERVLMIRSSLLEEGIDLQKVFIIPVPDIFRNPVWVSHVQSFCPDFSIVYTNNSLLCRLFYESGFEVKSPKLVKRTLYKGTYIRQLMIDGEKWEHLVPASVSKIILKIEGVNRIREINHLTD
jgi:nicotinamide-nucleotide adenylyltransferase